eukprot:6208272-Pleurochrysis_carterae.AAC.4
MHANIQNAHINSLKWLHGLLVTEAVRETAAGLVTPQLRARPWAAQATKTIESRRSMAVGGGGRGRAGPERRWPDWRAARTGGKAAAMSTGPGHLRSRSIF